MILIVDAGSTSSKHLFVENGTVHKSFVLDAINPFHHTEEEIQSRLLPLIEEALAPEYIHFFGTGCKGASQLEKIENALMGIFPDAKISIQSDLKGAAIAAYGENSGLIGILGTGSILAYYDGIDIKETCFASGYLFGDECSGYHLGNQLLSDYFKDELPEALAIAFTKKYNPNKTALLEEIYDADDIKTTVAEFALFLGEHIDSEYTTNVFDSAFEAFIMQRNKLAHKATKISLSGSIAWHFRELIQDLLKKHKLELGVILKDPMEGLVKHFSSKVS